MACAALIPLGIRAGVLFERPMELGMNRVCERSAVWILRAA